MSELFLRDGDLEAARALVLKHHYSHRMAAAVQFVATWHRGGGLFGDYGEAIAAVTFSEPPTRWSEHVWELTRLVKIDGEPSYLSSFLSQAIQVLRRNRRMDLLVSFADWTQRHHGGIYQACSWKFAGKSERTMDGVEIDGLFVPGRTCNARWGTRSPDKLRAMGVDCEPHFDEGKSLYWKPLNRSGAKKAKRLGLQDEPSPKPIPQSTLFDEDAA